MDVWLSRGSDDIGPCRGLGFREVLDFVTVFAHREEILEASFSRKSDRGTINLWLRTIV